MLQHRIHCELVNCGFWFQKRSQLFIRADVFAQPKSNRASSASASVTTQDDSYTRVAR